MNSQYEVLNPLAEVDPIPLRGISPRVRDLAYKTIGLVANNKRASRPMQDVIEAKLKERFHTLKFSRFELVRSGFDVTETEVSQDKVKFEEWVKGVDTVIFAHGD